MFLRSFALASLSFWIPALAQAQLKETKVAAPTRLDWAFAVQGFGAGSDKLPAGYDSAKQRYQLFVPKAYDKTKTWPLVLFISPGDQPAGWNAWKTVCEREGVFFCSPFLAGNNVAAGQRTRIVLDMLDDVRRNYRIDPDQTYIAGFSGGGRMACSIAFALPELFGGVAPVCGTNPLSGPAYLRHHAMDRLSVAFITGETDFNRKENEVYMQPWFADLDIRSKLWVAPKVGHEIPSDKVMAEVYAWLKEDLKRRRQEAKARPGLVLAADEAPGGAEQAKRFLDTAKEDLAKPERVWRGVTLLQGVAARWSKTESGPVAKKLLAEIAVDEKYLKQVEEQGSADEIKSVTAQAKALERFGRVDGAIQAWSILAKNYEGTPAGRQALENIDRLKKLKK